MLVCYLSGRTASLPNYKFCLLLLKIKPHSMNFSRMSSELLIFFSLQKRNIDGGGEGLSSCSMLTLCWDFWWGPQRVTEVWISNDSASFTMWAKCSTTSSHGFINNLALFIRQTCKLNNSLDISLFTFKIGKFLFFIF